MDVINKFYSSVSNSVSQLSNVLPGNPLSREYEIESQVCSAGIGMSSKIQLDLNLFSFFSLGLLWRVYKGTKKSTKQEAAIFEFQKKQLEKFTKEDKEQLLEILRRGVVQTASTSRYGSIGRVGNRLLSLSSLFIPENCRRRLDIHTSLLFSILWRRVEIPLRLQLNLSLRVWQIF